MPLRASCGGATAPHCIRCGAAVLLALSSLLVAAACLRSEPPSAAATRVYRCAGGFRFVTRSEPQRVWLFLPERTMSLPQVPAGSGALYSDGRATLRVTGDEAALDLEGRSHGECVNQESEVVWEDARLRGVDFRAEGDGPAFTLEIDGRWIVFVEEDAGRQVFPAGQSAAIEEGAPIVYESQVEKHRIRIEIARRTCAGRGGAVLPATVLVKLDERTFRGCGRSLN